MSTEEIETQALKLDPKARARLAGKLLESLENLSEEENAQLWAEEAERRDADPGAGRPASQVFQDVRSRLK
ncbi:MAG: addiction module protein [Acidobacteria bacterium]|nr:addiction module protein [Acidobacteriota bacterium]